MPSVHIPSGTQFKTLPFEIKSFDEAQGIVSGYLSVFGNIDEVDDRVAHGAFKKTISDALSRKMDGGRKFLWPMLWMHSPEEPIGLFIDAKEDEYGLLVSAQLDISTNAQGIPNNPVATKVYSGFKMGYIDEMSIGYRPIRHEYMKSDGHPRQVRELKEIQLIEGSAVTAMFAANPAAVVTHVKAVADAAELKVIVGSTSGPIGPRDEAWDGAKAKRLIWAAAEKENGSIDVGLARKYFMVLDGDPQEKGSWGYPFWYAGASPHICVGAVKAIAALVQGARGAQAPAGLKAKVETLYNRINKKYADDAPLTPPWKRRQPTAQKTFESHYAEEMCEDLLEDWCDVLLCSLTKAMRDAFTIGDRPEEDMAAALSAFSKAAQDWVADAVSYNLSSYLTAIAPEGDEGDDEDDDDESFSALSYPTVGDGSTVSHMRARTLGLLTKAGARISASTRQIIQKHIDDLHGHADQTVSHARALHRMADALSLLWEQEGLGPAYAGETGKSIPRRRPEIAPPTREGTPQGDSSQPDSTTDEDAEISAALSRLQSLSSKK